MRSVWRITQNEDDADDAFQETMTQIWRSLPRIRSHANPSALVLRICINVAWDLVRRKLRQVPEKGCTVVEQSISPDVVELVLGNEQREQVKSAISRLPEHQAIAVSMRFLLNCRYDEIAASLECAESTARVHVTRGLVRLREFLVHFNPSPLLEN